MTLVPGFINAEAGAPAYDAAALRLIDSVDLTPDASDVDPLATRSGVRPSSADALAVSVSGGNSIQVAPGLAVLGGVDGAQGAYRVALDALHATPLTAADAVNPRKDAVYVQVRDDDVDGLGARDAVIGVEVGTPGPTPVEPGIPDGALLLGVVTVPRAGGGNATVEDRRVYTVASGGVLPVEGRPAQGYGGQAIYRLDTDSVEVHNGTEWRTITPNDFQRIYVPDVEDVNNTTPSRFADITVDCPGPDAVYMVHASVDAQTPSSDATYIVECHAANVMQDGLQVLTGNARVTMGTSWLVTGMPAGSRTIELKHWRAGSGSVAIRGASLIVDRRA